MQQKQGENRIYMYPVYFVSKGESILKSFIQKDRRPRKTIPNKDYYRSLIDVKQGAAALLDFDGDILMVNSGFEDLSGYTEQDVAEIAAKYFLLKKVNNDNPLLMSNLKEFDADFFLLTAQPALKPVHIKCQEIEGQKYLAMITPSKLGESEQQTAPIETIDSPAIIHRSSSEEVVTVHKSMQENDIRTALNGIIGYGSLLLQEEMVTNEATIREYVRGVMNNSKRMKLLLDKAYAGKSGSGQKNVSSFALEPIIKQIEAGFVRNLRERNLQLIFSSSKAFIVSTDEDCLFRVLHFLIEKAVHFTRSEKIEVKATHNSEQDTFEIIIDDIGMDIPQSIVQHIQRENSKNQYQTVHPVLNGHDKIKGLLLDLNLLEARLYFDAKTGLSQLIRLVFPASVLASVEEIENRIALDLKKKQIKVLVVEDDKVSARILNLYLRDVVDVELAFSGNEALNLVEHYFNQGKLFDMFILDINLPAPWDGFLLKKEIIKKWPDYTDTSFLAQTANTEEGCMNQIVAEKFAAYLNKPVIKAELLRLINKHSR